MITDEEGVNDSNMQRVADLLEILRIPTDLLQLIPRPASHSQTAASSCLRLPLDAVRRVAIAAERKEAADVRYARTAVSDAV